MALCEDGTFFYTELTGFDINTTFCTHKIAFFYFVPVVMTIIRIWYQRLFLTFDLMLLHSWRSLSSIFGLFWR
uniref:hypothetical protein n=1 Tax=Okeania sp. SIO2F4 TaxID=2607790 RepID=UPI0025DCA946|nr:hypothetical protein [Okeania sp. SIO2F4]